MAIKEGDVVLAPLPQADGRIKNRPVLVLREMPGYRDFLVCGISTQLGQAIPNFDDVIRKNDTDFLGSGLLADSVIRLGFLAVIPRQTIPGSIGMIAVDRHQRLLGRLAEYISQSEG